MRPILHKQATFTETVHGYVPLNGRQDLSCLPDWDWLAPGEPWEGFSLCCAKFKPFFNIWRKKNDLVLSFGAAIFKIFSKLPNGIPAKIEC